MTDLSTKEPRGTWVQTERAAHEAWAAFLGLKGSVTASRVMHLLLARVGENNAVVISQKTMAELLKCDIRTVRRAVSMLREYRWVEIRQIGDRGTVNAYVINDRVAWAGKRDGIRYSLFSASVVISENEQPDQSEIGAQEPLHRLPSLYPGEQQLPSGPGLDPPSQAFLDRMEPDLPATGLREDDDLNAIADSRQNDPVVKVKPDDL